MTRLSLPAAAMPASQDSAPWFRQQLAGLRGP